MTPRSGIKKEASIRSNPCKGAYNTKQLICWNYEAKAGDLLNGSTCHGDSGGPLFVRWKDTVYLAGITAGGDRECRPGTESYDLDVLAYAKWIVDNVPGLGTQSGDPAAGTDGLKSVDNPPKRFALSVRQGRMDKTAGKAFKAFEVFEGAKVLSVTLNSLTLSSSTIAEQVTASPLKWTLKDPNGVEWTAANDTTALAFSKSDPVAGHWEVSVIGAPCLDYQLSAVAFKNRDGTAIGP